MKYKIEIPLINTEQCNCTLHFA